MTTETNFGALKDVTDSEQIRRQNTDRSEPKADLADRFEAGLQWAERIHYRPVVSVLSVAGLVAVGLLTWWIMTPSQTLAIEDQIAFAPEVTGLATGSSESSDENPVSPVGVDEPGSPGDGALPTTLPGSEITADQLGASSSQLVVHVVGAVRRPGLVYLDEGARVADAIQAAGGLGVEASSELLNLASPVQDGMQVMVPSIGEEVSAPLLRPSQHTEPIDPQGTAPSTVKVNVNSASVQELTELRGVGPSIAAAIVDWRLENGPFQSVEDLESVAGIGPAKLETLRAQVVV